MLEQLGHIHLFVWLGETAHRVWLRARGVALKVQDVYPECAKFGEGPPYFKSKVRVILTNKSKHLLVVRKAEWDPALDGLPIQPRQVKPTEPQENHPESTLQLEGAMGWEADPDPRAWQDEVSRIEVPPNRTFRVWVGLKLDEPSADRRQIEIRRRYAQRRLGKLVLPIRKSHSKHEVKFKLKL
jgi:hypothetical protein